MNTKMIDDLSSSAVKSIMYELKAVKNYNAAVIDQFSLIHAYIKFNAEFTNEIID